MELTPAEANSAVRSESRGGWRKRGQGLNRNQGMSPDESEQDHRPSPRTETTHGPAVAHPSLPYPATPSGPRPPPRS